MIHLFTLDNVFIKTLENECDTNNFTGILYVGELDNWQEKYYMKNGSFHREDGPAVEGANGEKSYYLEGTFFREDIYMALKELT